MIMQIVINTRGSYIRKRGECFEIKVEDNKQEISARKVQSILITTSVLISTDAILLAHENNIDIIFLDAFGDPFSRIWHSKFGSTAYIRRMQLEYSTDKKGLGFAKEWICQKIDNQILLLNRLKKTRPLKNDTLESYTLKIFECKTIIERIDSQNIEPVRNLIFANEAQAGKLYFNALNYIMPDQYKFSGRSRRPAKDPFNAILNYGYGILYSRVERACILSGLDPFIGFLHTDNYGKKSFVFDIIELFRIYIDEIVVKLFSKRLIKQDMFRKIKNGITLEKEGKQLLILNINEEMEKTERYRGRNIKKINIMEFECHRIANILIGRKTNADLANI